MMHRVFSIIVISLLICLLIVDLTEAKNENKRRYYYGRRHAKQVHRYVNSPLDCELHEHFERCGPESHCELSCENLLNPPNCQADYSNPKCYFPRCVCSQGYVRHHNRCVEESYCSRHHHHSKRIR